jgi:hypothetical protein
VDSTTAILGPSSNDDEEDDGNDGDVECALTEEETDCMSSTVRFACTVSPPEFKETETRPVAAVVKVKVSI